MAPRVPVTSVFPIFLTLNVAVAFTLYPSFLESGSPTSFLAPFLAAFPKALVGAQRAKRRYRHDLSVFRPLTSSCPLHVSNSRVPKRAPSLALPKPPGSSQASQWFSPEGKGLATGLQARAAPTRNVNASLISEESTVCRMRDLDSADSSPLIVSRSNRAASNQLKRKGSKSCRRRVRLNYGPNRRGLSGGAMGSQ